MIKCIQFEAVNKKLIEKLNTVASYSNINQVLIGFNQWYDVANEVEVFHSNSISFEQKNVFYKSDILNVILLNFFSSQQDSQTEKLFSQFFMNFYQFDNVFLYSTQNDAYFIHSKPALRSSRACSPSRSPRRPTSAPFLTSAMKFPSCLMIATCSIPPS